MSRLLLVLFLAKQEKNARHGSGKTDFRTELPAARRAVDPSHYTLGNQNLPFAKIAKKERQIFTLPEKKKIFRKWRKHSVYTAEKK